MTNNWKDLSGYQVDEDKFTESEKNTSDLNASFYNSSHTVAVEKKTNKTFIKIEIAKSNPYHFDLRYQNFILIMGNSPPFGQFKGYNEDENITSFYIQYDQDRSLQHVLDGNDLWGKEAPTVKSKTVFAAAAALAYCHLIDVSCKFIHPESIIYDENLEPYIVNLGYSQSILNSDNTNFNERMTDLSNPLFKNISNYISPEMLKYPHSQPFPADVYSFGSLLYTIITGQPMFKSNNKSEILDLIQKGHPDIQDGLCNQSLKQLVINCHTPNPDKRYTSSQILDFLISLKEPLFKDCKMAEYKEYQQKILRYIYYNQDISTNESDPRKLFVRGSCLLNKIMNDVDANRDSNQNASKDPNKDPTTIKLDTIMNICNYLSQAAQLGFTPAIYKYALFLDSNIYTEDDPFKWMSKAANAEVYNAMYKLGEMYDRKGLYKKAFQVYEKYKDYNTRCKINYGIAQKAPIQTLLRQPIKIYEQNKTPSEAVIEILLYSYLSPIRNKVTKETAEKFEEKIIQLSKKVMSGKPFYLLHVLYRDKSISVEVEKGIDGFLSLDPKNDKDENKFFASSMNPSSSNNDQDESNISQDDKKCLEFLKKAADRLYEPAVADYTIYLLEQNKIKEAGNLLTKFFSRNKCKYDHSRARIQHAYAMYCEKKGKLDNNPILIKKALRIYKESADVGFIRSNADYVRLYQEREDPNIMIIKYYSKRAQITE